MGSGTPWIDGAWPGAQYVDYFSADVYENQGGNRNGSSNWNVIAASLAPGMAFAQSEGLPSLVCLSGILWLFSTCSKYLPNSGPLSL
jgi:hypothetical protein